MPLFDMQCLSCGAIQSDVWLGSNEDAPKCPMCGGQMEKRHFAAHSVVLFHEGFYEHLDRDPIYFSSKRELRRALRDRDLTMPFIEGSV